MELLCFLGIAAAVFINGFTDAPNAMATAVCTRALRPVTAAALGGVCNCLGVLVMYRLNSSVADTISSLVRIPAGAGQAVVLAALLTIALWGFFGWMLGVPTSESHGLIAGLTGGALAVSWSMQSVDLAQWAKVLKGFVISVAFGFIAGYLVAAILALLADGRGRFRTERAIDRGQVAFLCCTAFLHGAQDGLKFLGAYRYAVGEIGALALVTVSAVMTVGTLMGGFKIIKKVGMDMVRMEKYQGLASDVASSVGLLTASLTGVPVSTSHIKTTAIVGACARQSVKKVNVSVVMDIFKGWLYTFPVCGVLGFFLTKFLIRL